MSIRHYSLPLRKVVAFCLVVSVAGVFSGNSWAAQAVWEQHPEPQSFVPQPAISVAKATSIVRQEIGGRVLSANPTQRGSRRGVEVRVLLDGARVTTVFVDAQGNLEER